MIRPPQRLPDPTAPWVDESGRPTRVFYQYMREVDQALRELITALDALETTTADHETRITDLETP